MKKGWSLEKSFGNFTSSPHNFEWNKMPVLVYNLSQHWTRLSLLSLASDVLSKFKPNSLPNLTWDFENLRTSQWVLMAKWFICCVYLHSILPMKQGILLGQYLGAFSLMDKFKGRSRKQEWIKRKENEKWRMTEMEGDVYQHLINTILINTYFTFNLFILV